MYASQIRLDHKSFVTRIDLVSENERKPSITLRSYSLSNLVAAGCCDLFCSICWVVAYST